MPSRSHDELPPFFELVSVELLTLLDNLISSSNQRAFDKVLSMSSILTFRGGSTQSKTPNLAGALVLPPEIIPQF